MLIKILVDRRHVATVSGARSDGLAQKLNEVSDHGHMYPYALYMPYNGGFPASSKVLERIRGCEGSSLVVVGERSSR